MIPTLGTFLFSKSAVENIHTYILRLAQNQLKLCSIKIPHRGQLIYNDFGRRSSFWPIGHRFDGDLICMRKTQNCPLHTHIHGNGHQVCRNTMYQCLSCHLLKLLEQEALWCVSSTYTFSNSVCNGLEMVSKCLINMFTGNHASAVEVT